MEFKNFSEFYPFYLGEHKTQACKILHFIGVIAAVSGLFAVIVLGAWGYFWMLPVFGYLPAWIGHYFFEKNRPASFKWPAYSLRGDFTMFWHLLTGKLSFKTGVSLKS